ncbi:putative membrane protein [Bernardetia litoralis DSM 6794]|uniref:Putative membrane protein n=1 Tax=Bernardetia litoralis (strain ATCC 23117 / DSM 6794 / NBRC 15988 / NCIMB 1366 / Fx l1 / Sio-4) TaxID=880071 RepID=I4AIF4_BERLS|nr:PH domain-containing protein [Bernardetia litoralis]AFM03739.1 putative membrane protein [Bernardetia litoralis DSM 6794]
MNTPNPLNNSTNSYTEPTLWNGSPSWLLHLGKIIIWSILGIILPILIIYLWTKGIENPKLDTFFWLTLIASIFIPFGIVAFKIFDTRFINYTLTSERLIIKKGILTRTTDEIELYRVKDIRLIEPFLQRLVGLSVIEIASSDRSNPNLSLAGIRNGDELRNTMRNQVERLRTNKNVREVDFE